MTFFPELGEKNLRCGFFLASGFTFSKRSDLEANVLSCHYKNNILFLTGTTILFFAKQILIALTKWKKNNWQCGLNTLYQLRYLNWRGVSTAVADTAEHVPGIQQGQANQTKLISPAI